MAVRRAWMSWSSGKDSTFALHVERQDPSIEVVGLLVTMDAAVDRVAVHSVRRALLEEQADRLGLPLHLVEIPSPCPNGVYEARMTAAWAVARAADVQCVVFGDLFLADVRAYREHTLAGTGLTPLFPLWGRPTAVLAREMLDLGLRAVLTCVDPTRVPASYAGRCFDRALLDELPPGVDPCGENGEFHTFVWDGPGFWAPIPVDTGEVLEREGFVYCDVHPAR